MKTRLLLFLCVIPCLFGLLGCESLPERFENRFGDVPPQIKEFEGTPESVSAAAKKAFRQLDFNVSRASTARMEAASSINRSHVFGDSRQLVARLKFTATSPGHTEVEMVLTQDVASESMGGTHQTALRDNAFYQTYFAVLEQVIKEGGTGGTSGEK